MSYQFEKFNAARGHLMLPFPKGEAHAIADAFFEISLAIRDLDVDKVKDEVARKHLQTLRDFMDTSGVKDHTVQSGAWMAKAKGFSIEQKQAISHAVDELASWFGEEPELS